eukprot:g1598.t1
MEEPTTKMITTTTISKDFHIDTGGRIIRWLVQTGAYVRVGQILCVFEEEEEERRRRTRTAPSADEEERAVVEALASRDETSKKRKRSEDSGIEEKQNLIRSPFEGIVSLNVKQTSVVKCGEAIASFRSCAHQTAIVQGRCLICGKEVTETKDRTTVNMSRGGIEMKLHANEAKKMQKHFEDRLRSKRKLALVLDLDHTLMNCLPRSDTKPEDVNTVQSLLDSREIRPCVASGVMHYVRCRPGVVDFLHRMSRMYELHINTHGTRSYAEAVKNLLDPKGDLFGDRVISRSDVTHGDRIGSKDDVLRDSRVRGRAPALFHKTLSRTFPCDDSMAIALDDKWHVWQYASNCVQVRPYHFFHDHLKHLRNDDSPKLFDSDDQLQIVGLVLQDVHRNYYCKSRDDEDGDGDSVNSSSGRKDVKEILSKLRKNVLRDVVILFSGVIPLGHPDPSSCPTWIVAEALGARCKCGELTRDVTHVVGKSATAKMRQASFLPNVRAVNVSWVYESSFRWMKQPEDFHAIAGIVPLPFDFEAVEKEREEAKSQAKRRRCDPDVGDVENSEGGSSSSDELDDDDLAELEAAFD